MPNLALRSATVLVMLPLTLWILWMGSPYVEAMVAVLSCGLLWEAFQMAKTWRFLLRIGAISYILIGMLGLLLTWRHSPTVIYWILAIIWSSDIGAYLTGRVIGGPKLAPKISPKKTWAGFVGGLLCGLAAGLISSTYIDLPTSITSQTVLMALGVALLGHVGDLLESVMKRYAHIKDSSHILPGHGGLFDRLDSLIFVGIFLALYMAMKF